MEEEEEAAHFIPTELEEEILLRLPSNVLLRFKAVCRNWWRLISSCRFIQKHLESSLSRCNENRLFTIHKIDSDFLYLEGNNIPKKVPLHNARSILGCCDGLVLCLLGGDRRIAAVNPSTGRYVVRILNLSIWNDIQKNRRYSWFGRHPVTGEYILVLASVLSTEQRNIVFNVYSLACNNQNPILSSSTDPVNGVSPWVGFARIGTFMHGRLHCLFGIFSPRLEIVVLVHSFEANAKIEKMWCPVKVDPALAVVHGCLSVVGFGSEAYEVWVMKEYGNDKSWTKLANIEGCKITCGNIFSIFPFSYRLCSVMEYDFLNNYMPPFSGYKGVSFIDSLVSPDSVFGENEKD